MHHISSQCTGQRKSPGEQDTAPLSRPEQAPSQTIVAQKTRDSSFLKWWPETDELCRKE